MSTDDFIDKALKIHGDKYDYSNTVYDNFHKKLSIRCKKHNAVFDQTPNSHLRGSWMFFM